MVFGILDVLPVVESKGQDFCQYRVETNSSGVILAKAGRNALCRISSSRKGETNFYGCNFPKKWRTRVRGSLQSQRASFYHGAKIRNSAVLPLAGNLLGSAFPKPCLSSSRTAYHSLSRQRESSFISSLGLSPRKEVTPCERNTTRPTAAAL